MQYSSSTEIRSPRNVVTHIHVGCEAKSRACTDQAEVELRIIRENPRRHRDGEVAPGLIKFPSIRCRTRRCMPVDALVIGQIPRMFRCRSARKVRWCSNHDESDVAGQRHRDHLLVEVFEQLNACVNPFRDDIGARIADDHVEAYMRLRRR